MYARFKIEKKQINLLNWFVQEKLKDQYKEISFEIERKRTYETLKTLVKGENGVVNGDKLQKYAFPTGMDGDYDVFISHSHDDKDAAVTLASFLTSCCGLRVFLDSYVWQSADALLRNIDDVYCKQNDGYYNYKRRNYSTSHVHAMLSMAIMDIINKTDCCMFIDSRHSIELNHLKNTNKAQTLSPWLFEELSMIKALPRHLNRCREIKEFSKAVDSARESADLKMTHGVDVREFMPILWKDLSLLENKGDCFWNLLMSYDNFMANILL